MAKIQPMDLVKSMSGKVCEHSDISFVKKGDTMYTMKRCNNRNLDTNPYTPAELAHQTKFATCGAATRTRMKDPAQQPTDEAAFKVQKKYKTMYAFIFADEWAKL